MFFLEADAKLPPEGIFVLIGIAALIAIYVVLSAVKVKKKSAPAPEAQINQAPREKEPDTEAKEEKREVFRPVTFTRSNIRRIDAQEDDKNEKEESNT